MLHEELSKKIVHAAHMVHDELKFGFLEAVYGNALYKELSDMGLKCECQKQLDVYRSRIINQFRPFSKSKT